MKNDVVCLAKKVRAIYEHGLKVKFDLFPGSFQFPKDSCEGASRVFAHIAGLSFPQCKVELIEGYDFPNNERHYWVLVDNMVYDLTCDQFDGFTKPILGESGTPFSTNLDSHHLITRKAAPRPEFGKVPVVSW